MMTKKNTSHTSKVLQNDRHSLEGTGNTELESKRDSYEVIIIGSGPGGYVAAIEAAHLGLKTAIVEQGEIGGTCLNRGCVPTKALLHAAELYQELQHAETFGIANSTSTLDYQALRARKVEVCATLRDGVSELLKANGVAVYAGHATILSPTQIKVETFKKDIPPLLLDAENIIIAAGTTPEIPVLAGSNLPGVYTSDTFLEEIPEVRRLVVVGGGIVGMEFAHIYNNFGAQVTILITSGHPLRSLDRELGQSLGMEMKKRGVAVVTRSEVLRIEEGAPLRVVYSAKDEEHTVETDAVLLAKGRVAHIPELLAEGLELTWTGNRIAVDENMRTSVRGIYAIGDICTAGAELAHSASAEGIIAVSNIAGIPCAKRLDLIPSCVYTSPEIACVGLTEAEAKEQGIRIKTGKFSLGGNAKTVITNQSRSFIKIVATETEKVIGAQLLCSRATDMISEITLGIAAGMTVSEMLEIVRPHPTFEEAVGEALESVIGTAIHSLPRRR